MLIDYSNGKKIIRATSKAYNLLYKYKGFKKINLIKDIDIAHEVALKENKTRSLEELKVDELKDLAKEKEIEGYSKMKKDELIEVLVGE